MVSPEPRQAALSDDAGPLGIICGSGGLPLAVADAASQHGRRVVMFPVRGLRPRGRALPLPLDRSRRSAVFRLLRAGGCATSCSSVG